MTKRKGRTGSYGARYGKKIRERVKETQIEQNPECPECGKKSLKRVSAGIWKCKSCGTKVAGGSYNLRTETGRKVSKALEKEEHIEEEIFEEEETTEEEPEKEE